MNVINCRDDIKAGCYTRLFFLCLVIQAPQISYRTMELIIRKDPFWSEKDGGYVTLFYFISHTWCTLYMSVHATFFIAIEKRVWINQNYHLVNFMRLFRFETFLWIRYIRDLKDRKKLWWRQARVSIIQF